MLKENWILYSKKLYAEKKLSDSNNISLDLHRLSPSVRRSWAFVHNAVSCAITLKSLGSSQQVKGITGRLMEVLEKEEKGSEWCDADTNVRCFGPFSRALKALREICR